MDEKPKPKEKAKVERTPEQEEKDAARRRYAQARLAILRPIKRFGWYWPGE